MAVPTVSLSENIEMPVLGYGTWQALDEELETALEAALEAGYRHIDTAFAYQNEHVIGKVLKRWFDSEKLTREDIFLVTKLPPIAIRAESVEKYLKKSLENLQLDYIDLYLIHVPFGLNDNDGNLFPQTADGIMDLDLTTDHISTWKAMEAQVKAGLTRAIGISNFNRNQIQRILDNSEIPPACLQVELHAYLQQKDLVDFCKKNNIVVTAYSPLGAPGIGQFAGNRSNLCDIMRNSTVLAIASKHNKSPAQIVLRHAIQKGLIVIPKSTNPKRLAENYDIFDFELDESDMSELNNLDKGIRILNFSVFTGCEDHPEYPFKEEINK